MTTPEYRARRAKYNSPEHRATRAAWAKVVAAGAAHCWRCGRQLTPTAWVLGHDDDHPEVVRGPECVPCNNRAGARKGNRVAARRGNRVAGASSPVVGKAFVRRRW